MKHFLCAVSAVVLLAAAAAPAAAAIRTYYIAADEVVWNYAPLGRDAISGKPLPPLAAKQLGWSYRKAIYREYTDATFSHVKARPAADAYLGFLGPIIHAEVGDTIVVVFRNHARFPLSVHAHGVFYKKDSEGAPYADGTSGAAKADDAVPPGHTFTYTWQVPERAGPGPGDGSSVMWMYHSHTNEVSDVTSGPVGAIVVTKRGMANPDGTPRDVDRELFLAFAENDENWSRYVDANVGDVRINPRHVKGLAPTLADDELYSINGFVYGNMPLVTIHVGQRVRWYTMATMSDFDFHSPHWHGNTLVSGGMRTDLLQLFPMQMVVGDMVPDDPGIWLVHCHVNVHLAAGMEARYEVVK